MKKIKCYISIILVVCGFVAKSQQLVLDTIATQNSTGNLIVLSSVIDNQNNIYSVGLFSEIYKFANDSIISKGETDVFLQKKDSTNQILFTKQLAGSKHENIYSLVLDNQQNIYVSGSFSGICYIDTDSLVTTKYSENFILKFDNNGKLVNKIQFTANTKANPIFLATDSLNNIYATSTFCKTLDFESTQIKSQSGSDIFVLKLNSDLKLLQNTTLSEQGNYQLTHCTSDSAGNLYLTGCIVTELNKNYFFTKLSSQLETEFIKISEDGFNTEGKYILISKTNVYVAGNFAGEVNFDKTVLKSENSQDVFLIKYDTNGNLIFAQNIANNGFEEIKSIISNSQDDIYLTGIFYNQISNSKQTLKTDNVENNIFIAKFDTFGNFKWFNQHGGNNLDYTFDLMNDKTDYFYQFGNFAQDYSFTKDSIKSIAESNTFMTKFYDCDLSPKINLGNDTTIYSNSYLIIPDSTFTTYLWNNSTKQKTLKIDTSGIYSLIVINKIGCISNDSIEIKLENSENLEIISIAKNDLNQLKILEKNLINKLEIFPNPFTNIVAINFKVSEAAITTIKIYNLYGQLQTTVLNEYKTQGEYVLEYNLSQLSIGLYICIMQNGNNTVVTKIVKS